MIRPCLVLVALLLCVTSSFAENSASREMQPVKIRNGVYIDATTGKTIINVTCDKSEEFSEGVAAFMSHGKWGYMDSTGKTIIKPSYQATKIFSHGLAPVKARGKWGYIGKTGVWVVTPTFADAQPFDAEFASVTVGKKHHIVGISGRTVKDDKGRPLVVDFIGTSGDGLTPINIGGNMGPGSYNFENVGGKWAYLNNNGEFAIKPQEYYSVSEFNNGYAIVETTSHRFKVINKRGESIFHIPFDGAERVEGFRDLFLVSIGSYGYIFDPHKTQFKSVEKFDRNTFNGFKNGVAVVSQNGAVAIIATDGSLIRFNKYKHVKGATYNGDLIAVANALSEENKLGYINAKGELVVDFKYDTAEPFINGVAVVGIKVNDDIKKFLIHLKGVEVNCDKTYENYTKAILGGYKCDSLDGLSITSTASKTTTSDEETAETESAAKGSRNWSSDAVYSSGLRGYFFAGVDDKFGLINQRGGMIIQPSFDRFEIVDQSIFGQPVFMLGEFSGWENSSSESSNNIIDYSKNISCNGYRNNDDSRDSTEGTQFKRFVCRLFDTKGVELQLSGFTKALVWNNVIFVKKDNRYYVYDKSMHRLYDNGYDGIAQINSNLVVMASNPNGSVDFACGNHNCGGPGMSDNSTFDIINKDGELAQTDLKLCDWGMAPPFAFDKISFSCGK